MEEDYESTQDATASLLLTLSNSAHPAAPADPSFSDPSSAAGQPTLSSVHSTDSVASDGGAQSRRSQVSALPRKEWTAAEDELIKDGVERLGCRWRVIAAMLPGRSDDAVRNRWSRLQDSYRVQTDKKPDTAAATTSRSGGGSDSGGAPSTIGRGGGENKATCEPGRRDAKGEPGGASSGKSGGSRSKSNSKAADAADGGGDKVGSSTAEQAAPKKERTSWTRSEDDVIMQGVSELGHKWYEIARRLPGRTDHAIRNRWSRLQSILGLQDSGCTPTGFAIPNGASRQELLKKEAGSAALAAVGAIAPAMGSVSAEVQTTPVPLAALAAVEPSQGGSEPCMHETSNSEASEATMAISAVGPAELLLLQSSPSCHASPLLSAQPPSAREGAEVAELLLLQSSQACHASPLSVSQTNVNIATSCEAPTAMAGGAGAPSALPEGAAALLLVNKRARVDSL